MIHPLHGMVTRGWNPVVPIAVRQPAEVASGAASTRHGPDHTSSDIQTPFYQIPAPQPWYMAPTRGLDLAATQQYRELPEDAW